MNDEFVLSLYVAGKTPQAERALADLAKSCEEEPATRCRLEVIDVLEDPAAAERDRVMATPTVVKRLPPPVRRVVGNLSQSRDVVVGLDIVRTDYGSWEK